MCLQGSRPPLPPTSLCRNHEGRADRQMEGRRAATGMERRNGRLSADGNWYIEACYCFRNVSVQSVPHSKQCVIQTSQLMLYREIIAVCSQIHTKHINTLCGQNVELLNVKLAVHKVTTGGTYSDHCRKWRYI
jgi:hypothetical protein